MDAGDEGERGGEPSGDRPAFRPSGKAAAGVGAAPDVVGKDGGSPIRSGRLPQPGLQLETNGPSAFMRAAGYKPNATSFSTLISRALRPVFSTLAVFFD